MRTILSPGGIYYACYLRHLGYKNHFDNLKMYVTEIKNLIYNKNENKNNVKIDHISLSFLLILLPTPQPDPGFQSSWTSAYIFVYLGRQTMVMNKMKRK